ncbi:reverse transcriptase domain-containing protein [Tanacetum coccineum]
MTESPFVDSGFAVPVFSPGDDPIACLNKAMAFLTAVASSRFPSTNNQLRTSSNPRNQATIQDGRVTVQQVQGRQGQNYSGTTYKGNATSSRGNTTSGQARVVKCYNCQGEGHMARQCTQPKRPRNAAWYKEKAMLAKAQEAGQILDEEQLAFLADPGIPAGQAQTIIPHNVAFQTEDLDTYDSDCDDLSTAQAVLMANISNYGSDIISEVPNSETYLNDMDNQSVHALQDFEQSPVMDFIDNEISSDSNIIPYSQYLQETQQATVQDTNLQAQQDSMILSVIEQIYKERVKNFDLSSREKMIDSQMDDMIREKLALKEQVDSLEQNLSKQIKEKESVLQTFVVFKNESKEKENKYMENEIDLEKKIKELDNIICKVGQSAQTVHMLTKPQAFYDNTHKQALGYQNPFYLKKAQRIKPTLYDGVVMSNAHVAMPVIDDEETLILEEESRSKMYEKAKDPEVIAKKISHKPIDYEKLNRLTEDFGKHFSPQQELSAEQAFWFHILNPTIEPPYTPPVIVDVPSELPKVWIMQISQENGQNRTNMDTGTDRVYKSRENAFKVNQAVMSADSAVTYTSVHSEARSWMYIPEPEHPEDLVPAEDEAPIPLLPPSFLAPQIRPLSPRALEVEMRDVASAYYHSVHPSGTPPVLPIPLPAPSSSRRADVPEADAPPRKRLLLTTPRPGCEIGESSAAAAARQPGPTIETRLLDTERRMMTALELVNRRISYQVDVCTRESSEFCTRHHDAQKDCAAVRAEIEILRRERLAYEQESIQSRQDLARSEAYSRTLEARITLLETEARRHEWQRQAADDLAVQHIMRTQALEAGARI